MLIKDYLKKIYSVGQHDNNSTNTNKMNYHPSLQTIEHKKRPQHIALEIQVLALDRHTSVVGLNWLMRS